MFLTQSAASHPNTSTGLCLPVCSQGDALGVPHLLPPESWSHCSWRCYGATEMEAWMRHTRLGSHSQWEQTQGNSTGVLTEELACTATRLSAKQGNELENSTEIQCIKPRKWLFSELIPRTCVNCSYCKDKERDTYSLLTSTQAVTGSVQQDSFTFQFIWVSSFHNSFNICKLSAAVTGLLSLSHIMP